MCSGEEEGERGLLGDGEGVGSENVEREASPSAAVAPLHAAP